MLNLGLLENVSFTGIGPSVVQLRLVDAEPQPDDATLQALSAAAVQTLEAAAFVGTDRCEFRSWELCALRVDELGPIGPLRVALVVRFRQRLVARSTITLDGRRGLHAA